MNRKSRRKKAALERRAKRRESLFFSKKDMFYLDGLTKHQAQELDSYKGNSPNWVMETCLGQVSTGTLKELLNTAGYITRDDLTEQNEINNKLGFMNVLHYHKVDDQIYQQHYDQAIETGKTIVKGRDNLNIKIYFDPDRTRLFSFIESTKIPPFEN